MSLIVLVVICVAVVAMLRYPLSRFPMIFCAAAVLLLAAYLAAAFTDVPYAFAAPVFAAMQKCTLPFALFTVVMFIGVLPEGSAWRRSFQPARGTLSLVACILALGHVAVYLSSYGNRFVLDLGLNRSIVWSIGCALVLVLLLVVLGVTSIPDVKRSMASWRWRSIQRLSYLFFVLIFVHAALALVPSALLGSAQATTSLCGYGVILAAYATLRLWRAFAERRASCKRRGAAERAELGWER